MTYTKIEDLINPYKLKTYHGNFIYPYKIDDYCINQYVDISIRTTVNITLDVYEELQYDVYEEL